MTGRPRLEEFRVGDGVGVGLGMGVGVGGSDLVGEGDRVGDGDGDRVGDGDLVGDGDRVGVIVGGGFGQLKLTETELVGTVDPSDAFNVPAKPTFSFGQVEFLIKILTICDGLLVVK